MDKILVTKSTLPQFDDYVKEIESIWQNHWLTNNGEKSQKLEKKLEEFLQIKNVTLFTNGHLALELTLQALDLQGEVITTPFTFASTTHAIVRNGLVPVFCDINPNDYTIDVSKIEELITEKTVAILPVHVYGNICDVEKINEIAQKYNLKVIYDAAHAFGVTYKNKGISSWGDVSMFSFHATKVFNTIEGGAVAYSSDQLNLVLEKIKNFGIADEETIDIIGSNAKMNEFQAAMGLCNLKTIKDDINRRKALVERYRNNLESVVGIKCNSDQEDVESNYAYFPIIIEEESGTNRDELISLLNSRDIYPRKYFYPITSQFDCYKDKFISDTTPIALSISQRVITLPLYSDLEIDTVDYICSIIKSVGEKK